MPRRRKIVARVSEGEQDKTKDLINDFRFYKNLLKVTNCLLNGKKLRVKLS